MAPYYIHLLNGQNVMACNHGAIIPVYIISSADAHIHVNNMDVTAWFMITIVTIGIAMGDKLWPS